MSQIQALSRDAVKVCGLVFTRPGIQDALEAMDKYQPPINLAAGTYLITPALYYHLTAGEAPSKFHNRGSTFTKELVVEKAHIDNNGAYYCQPGMRPVHGYITCKGFEPSNGAFLLGQDYIAWIPIRVVD